MHFSILAYIVVHLIYNTYYATTEAIMATVIVMDKERKAGSSPWLGLMVNKAPFPRDRRLAAMTASKESYTFYRVVHGYNLCRFCTVFAQIEVSLE